MCIVCDRIDLIKQNKNPYFVKELKTGYVVIGDFQHFKGYTLFLYKHHKHELFELDNAEQQLFMQEMIMVAEAVNNAFGAQKMNYELLGMGDSHLHWHLFPRSYGDLGEYGNNGNGPVWWLPKDKMYNTINKPSSKELASLKDKLIKELNKVCNNT